VSDSIRSSNRAESGIRAWLPPVARRWGNRLLGALTVYRGPYADWAQAQSATAGYQQADILARVQQATERVRRGEADYEQDGFAMRGTVPASHALEALLMVAAADGGRLSVLDFGGGLGSHFLRWRAWLAKIPDLRWCVVEQPHFAAAGEDVFADEPRLSFATSIAGANTQAPNVVLASSVLHYLPDPLAVLDQLVALGARGIVIDRTPFSDHGAAAVLSQHAPKSLGRASYPLWLLPREMVYARVRERYGLLAEFPAADAPVRCGGVHGEHRGSVWLRHE
jgi:putative methyltransferase (TIGR04325 family)